MSQALLFWCLIAAQSMLAVAMALSAYAIMRGPRAHDRVLALDAFYVASMLMLILFGIGAGAIHYFEAALIIALLGFVGTAALGKFLMRGEVIE